MIISRYISQGNEHRNTNTLPFLHLKRNGAPTVPHKTRISIISHGNDDGNPGGCLLGSSAESKGGEKMLEGDADVENNEGTDDDCDRKAEDTPELKKGGRRSNILHQYILYPRFSLRTRINGRSNSQIDKDLVNHLGHLRVTLGTGSVAIEELRKLKKVEIRRKIRRMRK